MDIPFPLGTIAESGNCLDIHIMGNGCGVLFIVPSGVYTGHGQVQ